MKAAVVTAAPCGTGRPWARRDLVPLALVLAAAYGLKRHYATASADELGYVLGPTAALVELVTGARFVAETHVGYVSRELSTIILPSCAGVNFLVIALCALAFCFVGQMSSLRAKLLWLGVSGGLAYIATLVVNASRILIAVALRQGEPPVAWLSPEQVHRIEGAAIYMSSLLVLCLVTNAGLRRWAT